MDLRHDMRVLDNQPDVPASPAQPPSSVSWRVSAGGAWRRIALQAAGLWLVTRLTLVLFTGFAAALAPNIAQTGRLSFSPRALALLWQRWDAQWYLGIAQHGYASAQSTAFFPLYPLVIRGVAAVIGPHWLAAALLTSNLGALGAFVGLGLLAAHESGSGRTAPEAIRVFAAYPLAFFLAAPYTEGIFLALAVFGLLAMRQGRWHWATLCAALALLTRPTGIILLPPLLYEYGRQHGWWHVARWRWGFWGDHAHLRDIGGALAIVACVAGALGLYMLYLAHQFGDPFLFLRAEQLFWHHTPVVGAVHQTLTQQALPQAPAAATATAAHAAQAPNWTYELARSLVDLAPLVIFGLLTVIAARRLPGAYTLYMLCLLALILASPRPDRLGYFVSAGRYLLAAIPVFLVLARWAQRRPWLDLLLTSGGFLMQAVFAAFFLSGGWLV
ncbi:MAG TPA: mannosyltransferase family protein [Ktedonobacterales bacterium]|nr:mannosyltransferase family protein [Ktedonobacterales bacterium]